MLRHGLTTTGIGGRPPNLWVARLPVLAIAGFAAAGHRRPPPRPGGPPQEVRTFPTFTSGLEALAGWLARLAQSSTRSSGHGLVSRLATSASITCPCVTLATSLTGQAR
jgi:hypothetical protein